MIKYFFIFFMITYSFGLNLKKECPLKIIEYPNAKKYTLRFENYFNDYKCDLLPLYNILDKLEKEEILDYIDKHPEILPDLITLAKRYPKFFILLSKNSDFIDFLKKTNYNPELFKNMLYILKFIPSSIYKNMLQYIYFASYKEDSKKQAYQSYLKLKNNINKELISSFITSYSILESQFPNIKKNEVINDFINLKYKLSNKELKLLCEYNPTYLITFLYNNNKVENFIEYQNELIFIYKKLFEKYSYNEKLILTLTFDISPYLMEEKLSFSPTFKKVFTDLINYELLNILLSDDQGKISLCQESNYFGLLSNNNLKKLINFANQENFLYRKYLQSLAEFNNDSKYKIFNLIALVNLYQKYYPYTKWKIIKKILLSNLFAKPLDNMVSRVGLILRLNEIDYFQTLSRKYDWNYNVEAVSDDLNSKNAPKCVYILFTSVEYQNSISFIDLLKQNSNEAKKSLDKLSNYSVTELSEHRFTKSEKGFHYLDSADDILTGLTIVAAIALAPETGGLSLGLIALKKTGTKALKKVALNKIKKTSRKYILKQSNNSSRYLNKKVDNLINKSSDKISSVNDGAHLGALLFANKPHFKTICQGEN